MCCADMMSSCVGLRTKPPPTRGSRRRGLIGWKVRCRSLFRRFGVTVRRLRVLGLIGLIQRVSSGLLVVFGAAVFVGPSGNLLGPGSEQRGRKHQPARGVAPNTRRAAALDSLVVHESRVAI